MKFAHFFTDRPIFAIVLSVVITIIGSISYYNLPIAQYPEVALPTIVVRAVYPGASPEIISKTVATPLEQEINGVENMLYMDSSSTTDGTMQMTVTFKQGCDVDKAQIDVQNRVSIALAKLPEQVRQIGVTTNKTSPNLLLVVHLYSPDGSRDQLYISNYAYLKLRDVLSRVDGIGELRIFGGSEYSMRIWLNIDNISAMDMTPGDVVKALREQNVQVAAGLIGQPPLDESKGAFQLNVNTLGRLKDISEFEQIIVKYSDDGRIVRLKDVARVELGATDYSVQSYLSEYNAVALVIFQRPGSNAIATSHEILDRMSAMSKFFPPGLSYKVQYNPTQFVEESIEEVFHTLFEAGILVVLTVFIFLQGWRATIIPVIAIPVSLVGTFAVMDYIGFSLNNLSLFGLVLAIGVVVDDAIVVVENVERLIGEGMSPRDATLKAMDEVGTALIASALVLAAVFVPTAFLPGISGQFYRQFAITIAVSTAISAFVSLTLSPAMCAALLRPHHARKNFFEKFGDIFTGWFFKLFNWGFDISSRWYAWTVSKILRYSFVMLLIYVGMIGLTYVGFKMVPTGFIPAQDMGYVIIAIQLPDGSSLKRTDEVTKRIVQMALKTPGVRGAVCFVGFSGATRAVSPNAAAIFPVLDKASDRAARGGQSLNDIIASLRKDVASVEEGLAFVIPPPPVQGIGNTGGFKMLVQDQSGAGLLALQEVTANLIAAANKHPGLVQVFTSFRTGSPQIFVDVDRAKAQILNVPIANVFESLQVCLGSLYVNDFNFLERTYRVTAQADGNFRDEVEDILRLKTRSIDGSIVPLGSVATVKETTSADRVVRYNLYTSADITGDTRPGFSSGQALQVMEQLAAENLPPGFSFEWTDLAYQQKREGDVAMYIFPLCVLFVFLALSAQYESWLLPLAVILIVPLCLLFAITGIYIRGMDNNILTQIGFVVLVGLACKNAILIVEFAKAEEDKGMNRFDAAVEACRLRLRPILMTAFSFILGVIPLMIATGAGSEMRRVLGTAVFSGMLGVTIFGLFLTPVFYVVLRGFVRKPKPAAHDPHHNVDPIDHVPDVPPPAVEH
jgi:hydrophobe/amphiphile efflux-1 (HAE1) family protein